MKEKLFLQYLQNAFKIMNNRNFTHGKVSYKGFPEKMCPILIAHTRFDAWVAE